LPGAPGFERRRAQILGRAKAEPVLFWRTPEFAAGETPPDVALYRRELARQDGSAYALQRLYGKLRNRPELARAVLLREGYLYTETPARAAALVDFVKLHHLFQEPEVVIQRGGQRLRAVKHGPQYEYADGPERGERATVLLLDRIWASGTDPGPPLHVGLRRAANATAADRMRIERITSEGIVAELRYGEVWVPAVLDTSNAEASLRCEVIAPEVEAAVAAGRDYLRRRARVLWAIRAAIDEMVAESLPFDEPRTEVGQQDGNLRPAWKWAYESGWLTYQFNDDHYRVFDLQGRPLPPQVCIDFVTDALERASGSWWLPQDDEAPYSVTSRQRIQGGLDFERLGITNRRSVGVFVDFAWAHPEWFDAYDLLPEERVPFRRREAFFEQVYEHRDRYVPGDIVSIHGPREDELMHYHSFIIYEADPLSGMPTLLAANAGRPRIRTWEQELRSAPRRSIRSRIRPRLEWLESVLPVTNKPIVLHAAEPTQTSG